MKHRPPRVQFHLFVISCCLQAVVACAAAWPQFQCNAARTGWTPDSPAPPYQVEWIASFHPETIGIVQPVVYKDRLYIATMQGRLYALDPVTGERLWVREDVGTVIRTAAAGNDLVYVGNLEGRLHAVKADPSTSSGQAPGIAWTADLGFGISAAPLLYQGHIFIGTRKGDFFCLDGKTGGTLWKEALAGYVWSAAAADQGRVFVATDGGTRMYALEAESGKLLWRSERVPGMFVREFSPVVTSGKVFVRVMRAEYAYPVKSPYITWDPNGEIFARYYADLRAGRFPDDFKEANEWHVRELTENPTWQQMFAFDAGTGESPYVVGDLRVLGGWFACVPPPAVDSDGMLQVTVPFVRARFGRMDPATGRIMDIVVGDLHPAEEGQGPRSDGIGTNTDESNACSCGGSRVFWDHFRGSGSGLMFDVRTREVAPIPGSSWGGSVASIKPVVRDFGDCGRRFQPLRVSVAPAPSVGPSWKHGDIQTGVCAPAIWKDFYFKYVAHVGVPGCPREVVYAVRGLGESGGEVK